MAKYYYCTVCGNIIEKVHDSGLTPMCCMRDMEEMKPEMMEEKIKTHMPVYKEHRRTVTVYVGENAHPMEESHYIEWIEIVTDKGSYRKILKPGDKPTACFNLCDDEKIMDIYAYCNIHKLWRHIDCSK